MLKACVFKPHEEMEWIATDLGPELKESHPEVRVFAFDHNKARHIGGSYGESGSNGVATV